MLGNEDERKRHLGDTLRMYRLANKLTQKEAARLIGVTPTAVAMWETGRRVPSVIMYQKILDVYDVEIITRYR